MEKKQKRIVIIMSVVLILLVIYGIADFISKNKTEDNKVKQESSSSGEASKVEEVYDESIFSSDEEGAAIVDLNGAIDGIKLETPIESRER